jgi:hypothetical protein
MADNSSLFRLLWPEIDDAESAMAASRLGVFAAVLYSVSSAVVVTYRLLHAPGAVWASPAAYLAYLDAAIFAALAVGIFRLWRSAAIVAAVLLFAEQVFGAIRAHATGILSFVLVLFMISGARGTVLFHKYSRPEAVDGDA